MPEITAADFDLEGKSPLDLEHRRREIVRELNEKYRGPEDPTVPLILLYELVAVTNMLRRRTAGPPKPTKTQKERAAKPSKRATIDDLASDLGL